MKEKSRCLVATGIRVKVPKENQELISKNIHTQIFTINKFLNNMLMSHIIFDDQNIAEEYVTSNTKELKN